MKSFAKKTWTIVLFNKATSELMQTDVENPPRKLPSETYTGSMTIERFRKVNEIKSLLTKKGINLKGQKD